MKPKATVVITGAGTVTCQSVIKGLRMQDEIDVTIVTLDALPDAAGRYFADAFHQIPLAADPNFVDSVLKICDKYRADLLIPIVDYEFQPISMAREQLMAIGCLPAISSPEVIERCNDKLKAYDFFREFGFDSAKSWDGPAARHIKRELSYPLFLKPAVDGRSSIDCFRVDGPEELDIYLDKVATPLVQEFIEAPEFTADVLADWDSNALGVVIRQRIETKGGVSYKGRTVDDGAMQAEVVRLVKRMGIQGPANVQAFRLGGRVIFNEINPRFAGALALGLAAGLNSPLMLTKLALNLPVDNVIGKTRVGVTMLRYWNEVFVGPGGRAEYPNYELEPRQDLIQAMAS